jgi:DNA-binding IclR family transcriptional regulator
LETELAGDDASSAVPVGNAERMTVVLDAMAASSKEGMRLVDICAACGLSKASALRLLTGLVAQGLVERSVDDGRYFVALDFVSLLPGALKRLDLTDLLMPSLRAIAATTEDSVYLSIRSGTFALCIARVEGRYPIKTLALEVGHRRPLGVGAGSLALLAFEQDDEVVRIRERGHAARMAFGFDEVMLAGLIKNARRDGHAFIQGLVVPEMWAVGVPIRSQNGRPFAAISVSCLAERLLEPRRESVVKLISAEIARFEAEFRSLLNPIGVAAIQRQSVSAWSGLMPASR